MSNHFISKISGMSVLSLALLAISGCMGTIHLSKDISTDGTVQQQNIIFPDINKAWQKDGLFPNSENLTKIRAGIAKDDIYQLIGTPHFREGAKAREWDYIMKFYMPDESVKICQYKIIFDKEYKGQQFYWSSADCPPQKMVAIQPAPVIVVPAPVVVLPPLVQEQINLGADALFRFDKSGAQDILVQGQRELADLAQKLREYQQLGNMSVMIIGHTDRKGDEAYNMRLSTQRAQTVRSYLISQGINPDTIMASGAGESQPVQQCSTALPRQQEIDCLQPNRRVVINVTVDQ